MERFCMDRSNDLNKVRYRPGGAGVSNTSALAFGGRIQPGTRYANTETWNGSAWTEVNDLNNSRDEGGSNGTQTSALLYGGTDPTRTADTETWNGTGWLETSNLSTAVQAGGGLGADNTSALSFGGLSPSITTQTEEWTGSSNTTKTISTD